MEFSWDILSSRFHSLFVKIAGFFLSSQWTVLEGAGSSGTTSQHPSLPEPSSAPLQLFPEEAVLVFSTVLDFSPFPALRRDGAFGVPSANDIVQNQSFDSISNPKSKHISVCCRQTCRMSNDLPRWNCPKNIYQEIH